MGARRLAGTERWKAKCSAVGRIPCRICQFPPGVPGPPPGTDRWAHLSVPAECPGTSGGNGPMGPSVSSRRGSQDRRRELTDGARHPAGYGRLLRLKMLRGWPTFQFAYASSRRGSRHPRQERSDGPICSFPLGVPGLPVGTNRWEQAQRELTDDGMRPGGK